jgi:hypothetical protein
VFLPSADYGLSAGVHTIENLSSAVEPARSIARDINESGIVVGETSTAAGADRRATAWNLAHNLISGDVPVTIHGTFGGPDLFSTAHAVNNATPPVIVGDSGSSGGCQCDESSGTSAFTRAFKVNYSGPPAQTLVQVVPQISGGSTRARDINTAASVTIGGAKYCEPPPLSGLCGQFPGTCQPARDAVVWIEGDADFLAGDELFGLNNTGDGVGVSYVTSNCFASALYGGAGGGLSAPLAEIWLGAGSLTCALLGAARIAQADVVLYDSKPAWQAAVGEYSTWPWAGTRRETAFTGPAVPAAVFRRPWRKSGSQPAAHRPWSRIRFNQPEFNAAVDQPSELERFVSLVELIEN